MSFSLDQFTSTRPYLYHLTSVRNFERLLDTRVMKSTSELLKAAGQDDWLEEKRHDTLVVTIGGESFDIRDQRPLYEGKTSLQAGWTFRDLVRHLNELIFFWPGWSHKPIEYGERHFETYKNDGQIIMRVATNELFAANQEKPLFCKYNSGSPRTTQGKGSPRGPNTFVTCDNATFPPSGTVEVTYRHSATLPVCIESSTTPFGPWDRH